MASESGDTGKNTRQLVITFFPMVIAVLSLVTSIYNGYLNNKFVVMIQGGLSRSEYARTCRDTIDAYFQVKYRAGVVARAAASGETAAGSRDMIEAGNAVAKFGALATYLANLRNEDVRAQYTELYWKLEKFVAFAPTPARQEERDRLIAEADEVFYVLNNDCVASAKSHH
ncbi:MAG: hypothetical protein JNM89_04910 [Hyphomicrobiaceae bacterium]|nr:hypothetical protein [Hyphomicrobiaceae bacterium]